MLTTSIGANAQQADINLDVKAFLSFRPTTIGVGQELLINAWISPAPGANRQYHDLTLVMTKPDGSVQEIPGIDTYVADGTMWMPWVPDQVGEWTLQLKYPGEYFAAGRYFEGELTDATSGGTVYSEGVSIKPASTRAQKLTVQEEMIASWPESPLPTDYWKRPVNEENREWWPILGGYPWFGPGDDPLWDVLYPNTNEHYNSAYGFTPWVAAPETSHIVWTRTYQLGGLMGGEWGSASSTVPGIRGWGIKPDVILYGRCYHSIQKPSPTGTTQTTYMQCYDIRTGEIYWEVPLAANEPMPTLIEYGAGSMPVPGDSPKPDQAVLMSISNGYLRKYNSVTGYLMLNVSIAPMTGSGGTYYENGMVLGVQDLGADAGTERYRLIQWSTLTTTTNFAARVMSNTTYARSALPTASLIDWKTGIGCTITNVNSGGIYVAMDLQAFDLYTGERLWNKRIDEIFYSGSANVADHGKLALISAKGYYLAYDLKTGNEVWRTRTLDYPWDEPAWGSYSVTSAYGNLYWVAETGIYAIDWDNGNIKWKYEETAPPFEAPFTGSEGQTVYPFQAAAICVDGKIYAYNSEHTPDPPFSRGEKLVCIDAITGDLVWKIGMTGAGEFGRDATQLAVGDGYMTFGARDGVMYTFGRGLSETTISAPQTVVPLGQKVLLSGSILDLSPAQPGTPCVSFDSMAAQMEHIHLQVPINGVFGDAMMVGVPVYLFAVDPNGNDVEIGVVTSDGYSGTFAFDGWTPQVPGLYTITATFLGDESYGSSFATTYLTVAEGADTTSVAVDNTVLYAVIGATIAIIVVVVIVGLLILRKK